ncbi:hypothetical protein QR97_39670 [Streptomyces sp. PBH53]|nr:hypothetical protein QR97_39670 [Streptomyces sp. PBH53]
MLLPILDLSKIAGQLDRHTFNTLFESLAYFRLKITQTPPLRDPSCGLTQCPGHSVIGAEFSLQLFDRREFLEGLQLFTRNVLGGCRNQDGLARRRLAIDEDRQPLQAGEACRRQTPIASDDHVPRAINLVRILRECRFEDVGRDHGEGLEYAALAVGARETFEAFEFFACVTGVVGEFGNGHLGPGRGRCRGLGCTSAFLLSPLTPLRYGQLVLRAGHSLLLWDSWCFSGRSIASAQHLQTPTSVFTP